MKENHQKECKQKDNNFIIKEPTEKINAINFNATICKQKVRRTI